MKYVVYQVTCKVNGKIYVGKHQTENLDDGYMGSGKLLRRAIKKHGVESFERTILHVFDDEASMNAKEAEIVTEEFCAREDTYNLCPGGQGGWGYVNLSTDVDKRITRGKKNPNNTQAIRRLKELRDDSEWVVCWKDNMSTALKGKRTSSGTTGLKYKQRNHNPASHPRGPRGPYKKRMLRSSNGEDASLSRRRQGFDSPTECH